MLGSNLFIFVINKVYMTCDKGSPNAKTVSAVKKKYVIISISNRAKAQVSFSSRL